MLEASERVNHDGQPLIHASYGGAMSLNDAVHCQQQTVDAGRPHPLLAGRTQADGAFSLAMRPAENVPVYVMLPLDTVNAEGVFRYAYVPWFAQALQVLALSGVHGVAVDVWWCAIERAPRQYCWTGYKQLFEMVRACGLKLQVVLSFHACGGNVGDMAQVPLPAWILQAGHSDPDIFFTDRPRESGRGQRNKEYLSIWADDCPVLPSGPSPAAAGAGSFGGSRPAAAAAAAAAAVGSSSGLRTPLQCYHDFMVAFRDEFHAHLGTLIEEVVVGSGPCGELRYPSYLEANGWRFPGVGEFQCYDRRALASLAAAAEAAGHPEWGYAGPHDSGGYNSLPLDTDFFKPHGGSWDTDYGNFFLSWYSSCLLQHGDRLLQLANQIFAPYRPAPRAALLARAQTILRRLQQLLQGGSYGSDWGVAAAAAAAAVVAASGNVPDGNAAAAVEQAVQQSQALLQQLLQYSTGLSAGDGHIHGHGHSSNASSPTAAAITAAGGGPGMPVSPASGTAPAAAAPAAPLLGGEALANGTAAAATAATVAAAAGTAAGAAAAASLPYAGMLELAGSLLQELLQSLSDISSSLQLTAAAGAHSHSSGGLACSSMSDAVAAAAAAAAAVPGGGGSGSSSTAASPVGGTVGRGLIAATGSSDCTVASNVSMPTVSSLQSSNSVVDLPTADMLSDSHQHLAALSLNCSRDSDMGGTGGSSSPPLAPTQTGVAQLLPPAAAGTHSVAAATAALAASCNSSGTCVREGLHADGNSSSSDMSCLTTPDSSGSAATTMCAAAAAGRLEAGCSSTSSMECSSGSSNSPAGSSAGQLGGRSSSVSNMVAAALSSPAAAGNASSHPLLPLFLQLLSRLLGLSSSQEQQQQQQHLQQQAGRQLQQQHSQLQQQRKGLVLSLKIAGVHWWYNSTSHASELTAGYYNTDTRDGYSPILELCERYNVNLTITCVEMCDAQHPSYALCGPEGLLRQIRAMAAQRNVTLSGENALPIFTAGGIDATALDRVVTNVRACRMASLRSCSSWPGPGPSSAIRTDGSSGGFGQRQQQQYGGWSYPYQQQQQQLERAGSSGMYADSLQHSPHNGGHSSNGWPPPQQQQQHQHQRLLQQQQHHQQMLWFGADRMGGHQHTGSHITSNSRNFSELGTLLQVYGSGGSGTSGSAAAAAGGTAGAGAGYCGGFWQRSSNSAILGGRCSPAGDSEGGNGSNASQQQQHHQHHQQQQQQQQQGLGGKASGGSAAGGSSELLPAMRAFTFLRLGPEILQPEWHTNWMRFMHRMLNERA